MMSRGFFYFGGGKEKKITCGGLTLSGSDLTPCVAVGDSQGFQEVSQPVSWKRTILRARD